MVKMADVQIGQSDVMSPKWYHYGTISLLLHGVLLTLCNYWIPDSPVLEPLSQSTSIVQAMPELDAIYEEHTESSPEAVSANVNPFEEPDEPDIPRPNFNLNSPNDEAIQNSESLQVVEEPIASERPSEQGIPAQTEENTPEKHVDVSSEAEKKGIDVLQGNAKPGNGNNALVPQNGNSPSSVVSAKTEHNGPSKTAVLVDETALWDAYKKKLNAHFKSHRHYPEMARRLKLTGTVIVSVEIKRNGEVLSAQVEQSSGIEILDEAAVASAKNASPVPAFPEQTMAQTQKVLIPYRYSIN